MKRAIFYIHSDWVGYLDELEKSNLNYLGR